MTFTNQLYGYVCLNACTCLYETTNNNKMNVDTAQKRDKTKQKQTNKQTYKAKKKHNKFVIGFIPFSLFHLVI